MAIELQLKAYAELVDNRLSALLLDASTKLGEAMRYACLGSGKRLRPALCLASCEAVGADRNLALDVACAIEMVHCFSLIHDDLPAIDNDDLRRGRPTLHVAHGEAVAILAGDALFALAFETLAENGSLGTTQNLECIQLLAKSSGTDGLVAGETADVLAEGKDISLEELDYIHSRKTGSLIGASCKMGAVAGCANRQWIEALASYGSEVGLAFQIADDILNETSTSEQLGKAAGSDRERKKATYPALMGLEASQRKALELIDAAIAHLNPLPGPTDFLRDLAFYSVKRSK